LSIIIGLISNLFSCKIILDDFLFIHENNGKQLKANWT
jgi:hypothetical protein